MTSDKSHGPIAGGQAGGSANAAATPQPQLSVPEGLITAVVELVGTGPVALGAYTLAELTAVDAVVDFLEVRPSDEVLAEAVRSLAARQLLVANPNGRLQVRGDLGIALAFQQRAGSVLDARATGTKPGEPWRVLLLPQAEGIALEIRIDALGVHELGLYTTEESIERLAEWLPDGREGDTDDLPAVEELLAAAQRTALVTMTEYTTDGSVETAGDSKDLVLAQRDEELYAFGRSHQDQTVLEPRPCDDGVKELVAALIREAGSS